MKTESADKKTVKAESADKGKVKAESEKAATSHTSTFAVGMYESVPRNCFVMVCHVHFGKKSTTFHKQESLDWPQPMGVAAGQEAHGLGEGFGQVAHGPGRTI